MIGRGDRDVVRRTAKNAGAQFSPAGYSTLIKRASQDGVLTITVGQRDDLSDAHLKELLAGSIDVVRRRLFDVVKPARQAAIKQAMVDIDSLIAPVDSKRNFEPAQRAILALHQAGGLNEKSLLGFAKAFRYEELIAALSAMSGVKIGTLDRLIAGDRFDPIIIVSKTIGLRMGDRARADPVAAGPEPGGVARRHRRRPRQFRPPDALDRRARGRVLEDPPDAVTSCCRHCAAPRRAAMILPKARHSAGRGDQECSKPTSNRMPTGSATTDSP